MRKFIQKSLYESIQLKEEMLRDEKFFYAIERIASIFISAFSQGKKVLICGNGGSAADAQHIAAEFLGKLKMDRPPLDAEALHCNTSFLTAVANDFSYDEVFARIIEARGKQGDILLAISTSGTSKNIIRALDQSRDIGMTTVGFTGMLGREMEQRCQHIIRVPSTNTQRVQETHILIGHIICEFVEEKLFGIGSHESVG